MSALLHPVAVFLPMSEADVTDVLQVEQDIYEFPWTRGNFRDSIRAGYSCRTYRATNGLIGYSVLMLAAAEAHLLNLSVAAAHQGQGHGRRLLAHVLNVARDYGASQLFLEVRPSNEVARRLYSSSGFRQVGVRRAYYPARSGREDALVFVVGL
jgi:ribosomal-protein-alanine N-acetyltransferase